MVADMGPTSAKERRCHMCTPARCTARNDKRRRPELPALTSSIKTNGGGGGTGFIVADLYPAAYAKGSGGVRASRDTVAAPRRGRAATNAPHTHGMGDDRRRAAPED